MGHKDNQTVKCECGVDIPSWHVRCYTCFANRMGWGKSEVDMKEINRYLAIQQKGKK